MDEKKYIHAFEKLRHISSATLASMLIGKLREIDNMKEFLIKAEWIYDSDYDVVRCIWCKNIKDFGHKEKCELKELINREG